MTREITTVADLIAALTTYPPDAAVRLAVAPGYPQAAAVGPLACSPDDADLTARERPRPDESGGEPTVWIAEGAAGLPARDRPQRPRPVGTLTPPPAVVEVEIACDAESPSHLSAAARW